MKTVKLRIFSLLALLLALLLCLRGLPVLHVADRTLTKRADAVLEALGAELPPDVDQAFLQYVGKTYGAFVLDELAEKATYTDGVWDELTGNSLHVLRSLYREEPTKADNVRLLSAGKRGTRKTTVMTFGGDICFADNYVLLGTQDEQKKFIGNAVEVNMARVLCEALGAKLYELNIVPQRFAA